MKMMMTMVMERRGGGSGGGEANGCYDDVRDAVEGVEGGDCGC